MLLLFLALAYYLPEIAPGFASTDYYELRLGEILRIGITLFMGTLIATYVYKTNMLSQKRIDLLFSILDGLENRIDDLRESIERYVTTSKQSTIFDPGSTENVDIIFKLNRVTQSVSSIVRLNTEMSGVLKTEIVSELILKQRKIRDAIGADWGNSLSDSQAALAKKGLSALEQTISEIRITVLKK